MSRHDPPTIIVEREKPVGFAVVTLLAYIFIYPIGLLLNLVGLLTGPRRGCFLSMLLVFLILPAGAVVFLVMAGITLGIPLIDGLLREIGNVLQV